MYISDAQAQTSNCLGPMKKQTPWCMQLLWALLGWAFGAGFGSWVLLSLLLLPGTARQPGLRHGKAPGTSKPKRGTGENPGSARVLFSRTP